MQKLFNSMLTKILEFTIILGQRALSHRTDMDSIFMWNKCIMMMIELLWNSQKFSAFLYGTNKPKHPFIHVLYVHQYYLTYMLKPIERF